jgi:hypothetical protein
MVDRCEEKHPTARISGRKTISVFDRYNIASGQTLAKVVAKIERRRRARKREVAVVRKERI